MRLCFCKTFHDCNLYGRGSEWDLVGCCPVSLVCVLCGTVGCIVASDPIVCFGQAACPVSLVCVLCCTVGCIIDSDPIVALARAWSCMALDRDLRILVLGVGIIVLCGVFHGLVAVLPPCVISNLC